MKNTLKYKKKNQCGVVLEEVQLTVLDLHAWKFQVDFFFSPEKVVIEGGWFLIRMVFIWGFHVLESELVLSCNVLFSYGGQLS